ncbi:MAG: hypothetical protein H0U16_13090, partial [Actinobacteria bacterium]|nr:hypothetical protein [Actinomycetota bacterium]
MPLAPNEVGLLTLTEWDALLASGRVVFESPGHPLMERLRAAGVEVGAIDDGMAPGDQSVALVAAPGSSRILELARSGAGITSGSAASPDDLTSAHAAGVVRRASAALGELVAIMARLRSADGCPWDREQTHVSLEVHLQEEVAEVLEAIDAE